MCRVYPTPTHSTCSLECARKSKESITGYNILDQTLDKADLGIFSKYLKVDDFGLTNAHENNVSIYIY